MVISEEGGKSVVRDFCNSLQSHLSAPELLKLGRDRDRIDYVLKNPEIQKELESWIQSLVKNEKNSCGKNKTKALKSKTSGNSAFSQVNYGRALDHYNQSIAWMPHDDPKDMSIIYANRSAALFHLGEISLTQQDIKLAFSLNYPKELHWKLHERSGRCLLQQNKMSEACRAFKMALSALQDVHGDASKISQTRKGLEQLIKSNSASNFSNCTDSTPTQSDSENGLLPEFTGGESKSLRGASSRLTLDRNEKEGRFVVANEDIQPGDVILVQKAYVSTLLPEYYHHQCTRCFLPLKAPIFCNQCSMASYCSIVCRDKAWTSFHQVECKILGVLANSGISITCYMALRLIVQTGVKELRRWAELVNERDDQENEKVESKDGTVEKTTKTLENKSGLKTKGETGSNEEYRADHISLLQLVTHSKRRIPEDIFQRTIMTFFFLSLLKTTPFFSSQQSPHKEKKKSEEEASGRMESENGLEREREKNEDEVSVGTILLRSLQFLQFNAHEIAGWDSENSTSVFIGGGLFLSLALFNHSCNPAIVRYFINDTVVVRAVRTIFRGEQVTENYGPLFTSNTREERKQVLENQYWFQCQCVSCQENWPKFDNLCFSKTGLRFRCSFCHTFLGSEEGSMSLLLECRRCGRPTNILKSLKNIQSSEGKYNEAMEFLAKGREETALGILLQNIALFDSILLPPFRDYHLCQEAVRKCFLILGNKAKAQVSRV